MISQFHGDDIHLSWYLIRNESWKYITYGTGKEVPPRLYHIASDPFGMTDLLPDAIPKTHAEDNDLASEQPELVAKLDALLRTRLNYPAVCSHILSSFAYNT